MQAMFDHVCLQGVMHSLRKDYKEVFPFYPYTEAPEIVGQVLCCTVQLSSTVLLCSTVLLSSTVL